MDILQLAQNKERVFRITFPNGEVVLFKLLCWQDFKAFQNALDKQIIPRDVVVDRLLRRCILDLSVLETFDTKPAGIPYTIAELVMALSGPSPNPDLFNEVLEVARKQATTVENQIVVLICKAFPAYKPEDLMAMKWSEVVIRLAQAEQILISRNELQEPIKMLTKAELEHAEKAKTLDIDKLVHEGLPREQETERGREASPQQQRQLESVKALKRRQREMR